MLKWNQSIWVMLHKKKSVSHTDLVPVFEAPTKELVTTPITGLHSLIISNNTIKPLIYLTALHKAQATVTGTI